MDSLGYGYLANTNKLAQIKDGASDAIGGGYDLHSQPNNNYSYDSIGNLVKDSIEHISAIKWNVYGKITEIDHSITTASKPVKNIYYYYDAAGHRIGKKTTRADTTLVTFTWYVRDASGNVMATYSATADSTKALSLADLKIGEKHIYGSSRLGIVNANYSTDAGADGLTNYVSPWQGANLPYYTGKKLYELANHLGNVLATVSDKKIGVSLSSDSSLIDHYEADVQTAQDYYPFGMIMPGRMYTSFSIPGGTAPSGTTQVNGYTVPVDLALDKRTNNQPTEYVATRTIDLNEGFESSDNDDVSAYLSDASYAGTGNGSGGADGAGGTSKYRYGFNGKENDNEVKGVGVQIDYGFRVYDPRAGRFLSVDPLIKEYPQLTPFQFASNSPIAGVDRDGREIAGFGQLVDLLSEGASKLGLQRTAGFISTYGHSVNIDPIEKVKGIYGAAKTGSIFKVVQQIDPTGVTSLPEIYKTAKAGLNGDPYAQGQLLGMVPGLYGGFKALTAGKAGGVITEEPTNTQATTAHGTTEAAKANTEATSVRAPIEDEITAANQENENISSGNKEATPTFTYDGMTYEVQAKVPYKRPDNATTVAQRKAVNQVGVKCVTCGTTQGPFNADHKVPLAVEHLTNGTIDKKKMKSIDAVQPQCRGCSDDQGVIVREAVKEVNVQLKKKQDGKQNN